MWIAAFMLGFAAIMSSPSPPAVAAVCGGLTQEAEAGSLLGFSIGSDPAASGGSYILVPEGTGSSWSPDPTYRATYCFDVQAAGTYRVAADVAAPDSTSDSFFVAVNGSMVGNGRWDVAHGSWLPDHANAYQTADPIEVDLETGNHAVDVYLREDGTMLDTIALELQPVPNRCTGGMQEAEAGLHEGFTVGNGSGASKNAFLHRPEGLGSLWAPSEAHSATYCVKAPAAGVYRIVADVHADNWSSDSFFVSIDGGEPVLWDTEAIGRFTQDYVNNRNVADPVDLTLTAGSHTITVYAREDGTRLDRIGLERQVANGGSCRRGQQQAVDAELHGFEVGADAGTRFVHVPNGDGSNWAPNDAQMVRFCFRVSQAGNYRILANLWADSGVNDSFWVRVDGVHHGRWDTLINTTYDQDVVGIRGGPDPLVLSLDRGNHYVDFLLREDGTRLVSVDLDRQ